MKTKLTLLAILISLISMAQNGINYKALIKDAKGNVVNNQKIDIIFTISIGSESVYSESQQIVTDNNGIAIAVIGLGTVINGDYNTIDWKGRNAELNVKIDIGHGLIDFGNSQFNTVPYAIQALNTEGLEAIDEGNGIGWRLASQNPFFHEDIGQNALDLSISNTALLAYGASGDYAVAMGLQSLASGNNATAIGLNAIASGNFSFASGVNPNASGNRSIALGSFAIASGINTVSIGSATTADSNNAVAIGSSAIASGSSAVALGTNIIASASNSMAMGSNTEASGNFSTAMGAYTIAESFNSTAIGRYNLGGGSLSSWRDLDPIFEVGNGTPNNRSNALTVRKNGQHIITSSSSGLAINADNNGIFINNPGSDGIIIANPEDDGITINNPSDNGIIIEQPVNNGIVINAAENIGAVIEGSTSGLRVSSTVLNNPDIIIGIPNGSLFDNGIIESASNSDLILRSRDGIILDLNRNSTFASSFIVRNNGTNILSADDSGNLDISGHLILGNERIESIGNNRLAVSADFIPSTDGTLRLGNSARRWEWIWVENGTIQTSDIRDKKNIKNLNYGLAEVLKMRPVSYIWKNKKNPDTKLGLIAQDLLKLIPEVVKTHTWEKDETTNQLVKKELERFGVNYSDLIPILIKAIQEQNKIIKSHEDTLKASTNNFEALLSRIEILESKSSN